MTNRFKSYCVLLQIVYTATMINKEKETMIRVCDENDKVKWVVFVNGREYAFSNAAAAKYWAHENETEAVRINKSE